MRAKIINLVKSINIIGIQTQISDTSCKFTDEVSALWERLHRNNEVDLVHNKKEPRVELGLAYVSEECGSMYIAGIEVENFDIIPEGFVSYVIPSGQYISCSFRAATFDKLVINKISEAYNYLQDTWIPKNGYSLNENLEIKYIEYYSIKSFTDGFHEMEILLPVIV